eukprot:scaffold144268_cov27-Tisochrysis_lutea.AAC.1
MCKKQEDTLRTLRIAQPTDAAKDAKEQKTKEQIAATDDERELEEWVGVETPRAPRGHGHRPQEQPSTGLPRCRCPGPPLTHSLHLARRGGVSQYHESACSFVSMFIASGSR